MCSVGYITPILRFIIGPPPRVKSERALPEVEQVDIKRLPDGTSRGFAFVKFSDHDASWAAGALSCTETQGTALEIGSELEGGDSFRGGIGRFRPWRRFLSS